MIIRVQIVPNVFRIQGFKELGREGCFSASGIGYHEQEFLFGIAVKVVNESFSKDEMIANSRMKLCLDKGSFHEKPPFIKCLICQSRSQKAVLKRVFNPTVYH